MEILRVNSHRSQTNGTAEERYAEDKKGRLRYCCNRAWTKNGALVSWNAIVVCDMSKDLMADGKTPNERRLGEKSENHFEGPVIPLGGAMIEYHPMSTRDQSMLLIAGGFWKGGVLVADIEEFRTLDASEVRARKLNAKETKTTKKR